MLKSRPVRGEWIEIIVYGRDYDLGDMSRPVRGEWIEILPACLKVNWL